MSSTAKIALLVTMIFCAGVAGAAYYRLVSQVSVSCPVPAPVAPVVIPQPSPAVPAYRDFPIGPRPPLHGGQGF